jgi:hypothetical protein
MAMTKTNVLLDDILNTYLRSGGSLGTNTLVAFLVNTTPSATSTMTSLSLSSNEVASANGYARQSVSVPASTGGAGTTTAGASTFTSTGSLGPFTYICYVRGGSTTQADTTGTLIGFEAVIGSPLTLSTGNSYTHTLTITET